MTRGRVLIAATTLVALVAASSAMAGLAFNLKYSGGVPGDDEAIVRMTAPQITDKGEVKTITKFRFKKVAAVCDGEAQRITLKTSGRVPVDPETRIFKRAFTGVGGAVVRVEGQVSRTGFRVKGAFNAQRIQIADLGTCKVGTQAFKVKA